MTKRKIVAAVVMAAVFGAGFSPAALAQAPAPGGVVAAAAPADPAEMTDSEKAAAGCGVAAVGGLTATYIAGPSEITMLWGGGMLIPSTGVMLAVALLGQIGASACAIGVVATPTVLWAYDQSGNIATRLVQATEGLGDSILTVIGQGEAPRRLADRTPAP